jgi:hypothetical protein
VGFTFKGLEVNSLLMTVTGKKVIDAKGVVLEPVEKNILRKAAEACKNKRKE